jgi:hypothetical protein
MFTRVLVSAALAVGLVAAGGTAAAANPAGPAKSAPAAGSAGVAADILDQLEAIPGLTVLQEQPAPAPYRFFILSITQPIDHRHPAAGTFQQRFTLAHRGTDRPMVLHTTGYNVPDSFFRSEPMRLVDGNQISVEQRFFTPSRPEPADWSDLDIWQAATDHHRIVQALKGIYSQKWISTGASKGGMTSVYHRRFYPSDVDGTVAYVAPQDVINAEDSAYDRFFEHVGTDPACRKALDDVQLEALTRRAELVARYSAWATANNRTFSVVGSADRAFEFMVNGTTWAFWQYSTQSQCVNVPPRTASSDQIFDWLDVVYGLDSNTDQGIAPYTPYYYQAATQLGYPYPKQTHLAPLQHYRGQDRAESYLPSALHPHFQPLAMLDIDAWVKLFGRQLLFVYGQDDPWGAEPFRLGPGTHDSLSYTAPGANHGATIGRLPADQAATATAALQRWAGVSAPAGFAAAAVAAPYDAALDAWNPALDRRFNR